MRKTEIDYLLSKMLSAFPGVSILNISPDKPFQVESSGQLKKVSLEPDIERLTPFQTEVFALTLINNDRRLCKTLLEHGSCDFSYNLEGKALFRVNIFTRRGLYSIILRKLETVIAALKDLKLPEAFVKMTQEQSGLILVTGPTGSGKSTSLNALIHEFNQTQSIHIVTIEDPIKAIHSSGKATINQRELGSDFNTFAKGMESALRQAPQVILIGEIRDRETFELALKASEQGHLVLSAIHAIEDAGQTINRIVSLFPPEEEKQIRQRLAETVRWIVGQRQIPKEGGGHLFIHDILGNNARSRESILMGESEGKTFYEIQEAGASECMQTFDQALVKAFEAKQLKAEHIELYATRKLIVKREIARIKKNRGEDSSEIEGLSIESDSGTGD